ncbi:MAG TPA: hypothetical protein VF258_09930, partial [Luteolibacter sp.]
MNLPRHSNWLFAGLFIFINSCVHYESESGRVTATAAGELMPPAVPIGIWNNCYVGDTELAGVELSQCIREGPTMRDDSIYYGKHPAEVAYHFWDGRIRWVLFYPDGRKMKDQWLSHYDIAKYSTRNDSIGFDELK